jgi:hypothetical protein
MKKSNDNFFDKFTTAIKSKLHFGENGLVDFDSLSDSSSSDDDDIDKQLSRRVHTQSDLI